MPEITRDWVAGLSKRDTERALSLGGYHYRAQLLLIHTEEWERFVFGSSPRKSEDAFSSHYIHYYMMWTSMVYVVHEGFVELDIQDSKLNAARAKLDLSLLKRFRNGTFHYQPNFFSAKHDDLINRHGFSAARGMHDRHGVLVRRFSRLLNHSPWRDLTLRPGMSL